MMPDSSTSPRPHPSTVAWSKAHTATDRLFDALETLDELGGIQVAAESAGWTPKARKKAEASLVAARDAIERQLDQLRGGGRRRDTR